MRLPLPRRRARPPATGLAATHMHTNLLRTRTGLVWAWYRVGPHPWSLRSLKARSVTRQDQAHAWAQLAGRDVHLRMTTVPYPRHKWAEQLHRNTPTPLPDQPDGQTLSDWLVAQQQQITVNRISQPFRAVGVPVGSVDEQTWQAHVDHRDTPLGKELRRLKPTMRLLSGKTEPGLSGQELWWLVHRSVGLGIPPPSTGMAGSDVFSPGHMAEFVDPVEATAEPFADTVRLSVLRDGHRYTHHVAVVDLIRLDNGQRPSESHIPPWLAAVDGFPFEVEVSVRGAVIDGRDLASAMDDKQQRSKHIGEHAIDSGRFVQRDVDKTLEHAMGARDEVANDAPDKANRLHATIRLAVFGSDEEQALERAHDVTQYYARTQGMQVVHRNAQHQQYREFIPGEPARLARVDVERMPMQFWSTAWPGASSQVGDNTGPYVGYTRGLGRRAVMVDPHYPIFRGGKGGTEKPANQVIIGTLGSGKTYAGGFFCALAVRRGDMAVFLDPDGRVARLATVPELRGHTRLIQVTGANIEGGLFNPWNMIPDPSPAGVSPEEHQSALRNASAARHQLAVDTMLQFVHPSVLRVRQGAKPAIQTAVRTVGAAAGTSPWHVVDLLDDMPGLDDVAKELRSNAEDTNAGWLVFGHPDHRSTRPPAAHPGLTIITSPGLPYPDPDKDPADWSVDEQLSVPVRGLSQFYVTSIARHADRDLKKHLFFDEVGVAAQSASTVGHLQTLLRTSRGNTTSVTLISQDAADIARLNVGNWLSRKWLGRAMSVEDAAVGLALPPVLSEGYEDRLVGLSKHRPGEFVFADEAGQAEIVQVDATWWPNVHAAMHRERPRLEEAEWVPGSGE